jgi:hypothetical protein
MLGQNHFSVKAHKVNIQSQTILKLHCLDSVHDKESGNTTLTVWPPYTVQNSLPNRITTAFYIKKKLTLERILKRSAITENGKFCRCGGLFRNKRFIYKWNIMINYTQKYMENHEYE